MKMGVIISSNDAETSWNAFRYANFCLAQKDEVKVFLTGKGVEYQKISTDKFDTVEQAEKIPARWRQDTCLWNMHQITQSRRDRTVSDQHDEGHVRHCQRE
jgi:peroxiredoxin family protein